MTEETPNATDAATVPLRIGVRLSPSGDAGELFADAKAIEAAGADSLWIDAADADPYVALAAVAAVTWRVRLVARGAAPQTAARETCAHLARGRLVVAEESQERWTESPFPASRVAWDELRAASTAAGVTGVVLPNDPRLIDLLRNPDIIEARDDLKLSFG
jgi:alkanesulfonate monooxygenase SsuD/methylene tetrahydromethanopterin reductase-like flavin-dependent oxidoreductase (luciferase family)